VIVHYGTVVPDGFLPVHSVDSLEDAEFLLRVACPTNLNGEFVAPELAHEQTLENLAAFGKRLRDVEAKIAQRRRRKVKT
jgi:hypothetical protein